MLRLPRLIRRDRASTRMMILALLIAIAAAGAVNLILSGDGESSPAIFHAMLLEPFLSWASFSKCCSRPAHSSSSPRTGHRLSRQGVQHWRRRAVHPRGDLRPGILVWFPQATGGWIWPAMLILGAIGGALWAAIPAFWRVRLNANEILVTLMMSLLQRRC